MDYKQLISEQIKIDGLLSGEIYSLLATPKDRINGDFALPCFSFAKKLGKNPVDLAKSLAQNFVCPPYISEVNALNGFLNFKLDKQQNAKIVIEKILAEGDNFGKQNIGNGKVVCIDYSSINIAKPFHIGHLSTTVIGASLYKIYNFLGYNCVGINHLGDYGTQFGKLIYAYKHWGNEAEIKQGGINSLLALYIRFHTEAETNPTLNEEARHYFKLIEDGNAEALKLFNWFKELTLKEIQVLYDRLNVSFDSYAGESFYNDKMDTVIDMLDSKKLLVDSDGAKVVMLDNMPPCLIKKSDGATLYATRDLAAIFYRKQTYDFYKCLYVVAYQQNLHFKQVFKVVELLGCDFAPDLVHVPFGMVSLESGTLSTRSGRVVFLSEVLDKAVQKANEILVQKNPTLAGKAEIAETVGIGAVIYFALSNNKIKDIVFDYNSVLNFDGETGPYVQYTFARCHSVLEKAGLNVCPTFCDDYSGLENEEAGALVAKLSAFSQVVLDSASRYEPSLITRHITDICQCYNKFYFEHRIIGQDKQVELSRLLLTTATKQIIKNGLYLLGIKTTNHM